MQVRDPGQSRAPAAERIASAPPRARHPLASAALLLFVGLPSGFATLAGGLAMALSLSTGESLPGVLASILLFAGGLAGVWGSETLRRRVGEHTRLAWAAAALGVAACTVIFLQLSASMAANLAPPAQR